MNNNGFTKGQTAVETFVTIILILGFLLVVSVLSLQYNQNASQQKELQEQTAVCQHIVSIIERVNDSPQLSEVTFHLPIKIWVQEISPTSGIIFFSDNGQGYGCRFNARVTGIDPDGYNAGDYAIRKNANNQVEIASGAASSSGVDCEPSRNCSGGTVQFCGSIFDGCTVVNCGACAGGETCQNNACQTGETSGLCGNGSIDPSEVCDGANIGSSTCEVLGSHAWYSGGSPACNATCSGFETGSCAYCGDNQINGPVGVEYCDGTDFGEISCEDACGAPNYSCELICLSDCSGLDEETYFSCQCIPNPNPPKQLGQPCGNTIPDNGCGQVAYEMCDIGLSCQGTPFRTCISVAPSSCSDTCPFLDGQQCHPTNSTIVQRCAANGDSDPCLEWKNFIACTSGTCAGSFPSAQCQSGGGTQ